MELRYYIVRRLLVLIPTILGLTLLIFILMRSLPTTYLIAPYTAGAKTPEAKALDTANAIKILGLNYPLPVQYLDYLSNLLHGNWGYMAAGGGYTGSVISLIALYLPNTAQLAVGATVLSIIIAIPLGTYIGARPNSVADQSGRIFSLFGYAMPAFWLALLLQIIFGAKTVGGAPWQIFPLTGVYPEAVLIHTPVWMANGTSYPTHIFILDALLNGDPSAAWGGFMHIVLPVLALTYGILAGILRFIRAGMVDSANQEYVKTARAKGVNENQVIKRHVRRNALIPTITVMGLLFAGLLGGVVLIEKVFAYPGIGLLTVNSALPTLQIYGVAGTTLIFSLLLVSANLIVDIVYAFVDPRIRY